MRYRKPTRPVVSDHRREIDISSLARHGAFKRPMKFPFQGIESARDHIKLFSPSGKGRPPQIIAVQWRRLTFGERPFFICSRCNKRRVYLYFDGLFGYCRTCADLKYASQRQRHRTRLLHRSHRIRVALGDQFGKPGDKLPPRLFNQKQRGYHKAIATLRSIESKYLNATAIVRRNIWRERDELGRFIAEDIDIQTISDEGER